MDGLEQLLAMHGIRYNLTLHDKHNRRVFGMDNAHAVKPARNGLNSGKVHEYDHVHKTMSDTGTPYNFEDCFALLSDFFTGIDKTISDIHGGHL